MSLKSVGSSPLSLALSTSQDTNALCSDASLDSLPMCPVGNRVWIVRSSWVRTRLSLSSRPLIDALCCSDVDNTERLLGNLTRISPIKKHSELVCIFPLPLWWGRLAHPSVMRCRDASVALTRYRCDKLVVLLLLRVVLVWRCTGKLFRFSAMSIQNNYMWACDVVYLRGDMGRYCPCLLCEKSPACKLWSVYLCAYRQRPRK
jgi:hypothetical protein